MKADLSEIPSHELDAREEVKREVGRVSMAVRQAIYNVLQDCPDARLVRQPLNAYSIETLGRKPGCLATATSADAAWLKAERSL